MNFRGRVPGGTSFFCVGKERGNLDLCEQGPEKRRSMKIIALLFLFLLTAPFTQGQDSKEAHYSFQVEGLSNDTVYLANYKGEKLFYYDTTVADAKGAFSFDLSEQPKGGMYAVILPGKKGPKTFQLLIAEASFSMKTTMKDPTGGVRIENSKENRVFYDYVHFVRKKKKESRALQQKLKKAKDKAKKKKYREQLSSINKAVRERQKELVEENEGTLAAKFLNMQRDVQVPDSIEKKSDSTNNRSHFYYKTHFFDRTDLKDERLYRTPVFAQKVKRYFKKVIAQHPDSIKKAADRVLGQVEPESEIYRHIVHFLTSEFEQSKVMGMDEVFVHMALNYYNPEHVDWMDSSRIAELKDKAKRLQPTLIGKTAPPLILPDSTGSNYHDLHAVDAPYKVLYFWDPNCGHCKEATPKLKKTYEKLKPKGLEVFAVGTPLKTGDWKDYIRKKDLNWINVTDTPDMNENPRQYLQHTNIKSLNFRKWYDIYNTPKVYVLDRDNEIIAKGMGVEQLDEFLSEKFKEGQ